MTRTLNSFIRDQIRSDGIVYFILNYKGCVAHCRNQKRLWDAENDPVEVAKTRRYVDALHDAGDIR